MKQRKQGMKNRTRENVAGYLFLAPFILGFSIFVILPLLAAIGMSFTDWNLFNSPQFIGLENYIDLFTKDANFWPSIKATFLYTAGGVILPVVSALLLAILLNQPIRFRSFFRTIYYLPCVLPAVSTVILWSWLFNPDLGLLNGILRFFGLPTSMWIHSESSVMPSLWLMSIWGSGGTAIIFLAALQDVPRHLLEAANIDGANAWGRFRHITLPFLSPAIFFNFLMGVINALQVFVPAQLMTGGGPGKSTLFLSYYIYRLTFTDNRMGYACALAFVLFLIVMVLAIIIFRTSNRWVFYNEEKN